MSYFDQIYQQLFGKKSDDTKVLVNEVIERSPQFKDQYHSRVLMEDFNDLISAVFNSYELKQQKIEKKPDVHILNSQYANGFAISYNEEIATSDFQFLFDWLAERTKGLGYQLANSDLQVVSKNNVVESKEKHYLKPPVGDGELINQQYGNILIEHILIDDVPSYIRYTASIYSDRKYKQAEKFEELTEYLFQDQIN